MPLLYTNLLRYEHLYVEVDSHGEGGKVSEAFTERNKYIVAAWSNSVKQAHGRCVER